MITFRLSGRLAELHDAERDTPLVYVLRGSTVGDMTPRLGCGREQCGASRVLVDGTPAYACCGRVRWPTARWCVDRTGGSGVWCLVAALCPGAASPRDSAS